MNREDVCELVRAKLKELGVPEHAYSVRKVPAHVEVSVLMGDSKRVRKLRSGIVRWEVDSELEALEDAWKHRSGVGGEQTDIEQMVAAAEQFK